METVADFKFDKTKSSFREFIYFLGLTLLFTACQFLWLDSKMPLKIGLINIVPTFVYLFIWLCYCHTFFSNSVVRWFAFLVGFYLTLRIPITISRSFETLNWFVVVIFGLFVFIPIARYFNSKRRSLVLLFTVIVILFNSLSHIWLNSPFTYAFRLVNHLESNYTGVDNNSTWECPYEKPTVVVQCDMRHFIASEKIFTEPSYDASFSVFLRRFFYGYLSSLLGYENNRWFASFCVNITTWIIACVCVYRTCILLNLREAIAEAAMLTCASAWGFVSLVAQPAPYLMAYALAAILPLVTLELVNIKQGISAHVLFFIGVFVSSLLVYDVYPVVVACLLIFLFNGAFSYATLLPAIQISLGLFWSKISLQKVLGTQGDLRNSQVISNSLNGWINAASNGEFGTIINYIKNGGLSFVIAGFGFGIASLAIFSKLLCYDYERLPIWNDESAKKISRDNILVYFLGLSVLMLLASIFLAPESLFWNPSTGLLPRFSFYYFVTVIISASCLLYSIDKRLVFLLPCLCFAIPLADFAGIATIPLLFDYGDFRLVWK